MVVIAGGLKLVEKPSYQSCIKCCNEEVDLSTAIAEPECFGLIES
jgi:hypothetical protein